MGSSSLFSSLSALNYVDAQKNLLTHIRTKYEDQYAHVRSLVGTTISLLPAVRKFNYYPYEHRSLADCSFPCHYEHTPIQIYGEFYRQKKKNSGKKF